MSPGPTDYERAMAAAGLGEIIVFHRQTTGSTNDDARAIASAPLSFPEAAVAIVVAETQTKGRGRGSNVWLSPQGSIALTLIVPGVPASRLGVLPLGVGAAVVGALRHLGIAASVKWPNDVLIDGRKVCGILCESSLLCGLARAFIGIGINVEKGPTDLLTTPNATTLAAHGVEIDRPWLVADVTARVVTLIREGRSSRQIVDTWKAVSVPWWGHDVTLVEGDVERRVTLLDVSPEGQLMVRDEAGVVYSLASGEVRQIKVTGA